MHPLWSVLTGLLGFYFGHRFSLFRDRRKEFNEIAEVLFIKLSAESNNITPMGGIGKIEFETFKRRLPMWERRGFDQCREEYQQTKNENLCRSTKTGSVSFQNTASIAAAINKLLKFTKRR